MKKRQRHDLMAEVDKAYWHIFQTNVNTKSKILWRKWVIEYTILTCNTHKNLGEKFTLSSDEMDAWDINSSFPRNIHVSSGLGYKKNNFKNKYKQINTQKNRGRTSVSMATENKMKPTRVLCSYSSELWCGPDATFRSTTEPHHLHCLRKRTKMWPAAVASVGHRASTPRRTRKVPLPGREKPRRRPLTPGKASNYAAMDSQRRGWHLLFLSVSTALINRDSHTSRSNRERVSYRIEIDHRRTVTEGSTYISGIDR